MSANKTIVGVNLFFPVYSELKTKYLDPLHRLYVSGSVHDKVMSSSEAWLLSNLSEGSCSHVIVAVLSSFTAHCACWVW